VNALASATGTFVDLALAWHRFVERWAEGKIYAQRKPDIQDLTGQPTDQYVFDSADDKGTTFSWNAPDLSAAVYKVLLNYKQWPAGTKLPVRFTDPNKEAEAIVYKFYRAAKLERLQVLDDGEEMEIADADQLAKDGWGLLIVVSNGRNKSPYTGTTPIEVGIGDYSFSFDMIKYDCPQCYSGPFETPGYSAYHLALHSDSTGKLRIICHPNSFSNGSISRTAAQLTWRTEGGAERMEGNLVATSSDGINYFGTVTYTLTRTDKGCTCPTNVFTSQNPIIRRLDFNPCP
jgi:hypothetical protein